MCLFYMTRFILTPVTSWFCFSIFCLDFLSFPSFPTYFPSPHRSFFYFGGKQINMPVVLFQKILHLTSTKRFICFLCFKMYRTFFLKRYILCINVGCTEPKRDCAFVFQYKMNTALNSLCIL